MPLNRWTKLTLAALASAPLAGLSVSDDGRGRAACSPGRAGQVAAGSNGCQPRNAEVHRGSPQSGLEQTLENRRGVAQGGGQDGRRDRADHSGDGRAAPCESRAGDDGRREGLRRDSRRDSARKPQPFAHSYPRRMLRSVPRRGGSDRSHHNGRAGALQGGLGRLPHAARGLLPDRDR